MNLVLRLAILILWVCGSRLVWAQDDDRTLRVFIFAGQSNMVGSDSKLRDIERFPPFAGLEEPQAKVRFWYCIGRENKTRSEGWVPLQAVNDVVGPELSFARELTRNIEAPVAIIKCAAGGTHLGGDWNPDEPGGFKLYPLALEQIRSALAELDRRKVRYRIEGFMWHQGENDMFDDGYMASYGKNLKNFIASWRRDLQTPDLRFYIGELCTKTIWGMDLRPKMYAISRGQREVCAADPLVDYVRTSQVGVEIGGGAGLHYHYGTLGQLQHGLAYAEAYLRNIGRHRDVVRKLRRWPYPEGSPVKLFVLIGHRNMEGERAFVQDLARSRSKALLRDDHRIAYRYSLGGGYRASEDWEPLGPVGYHDTFGPELSFGARLRRKLRGNVAIAKFSHSGSQIIDWTPEGSEAVSRNLYPDLVAFTKAAIGDLAERGHEVELAGIFYHLGENDMSFGPYRKAAAGRLAAIVAQSRNDLGLEELPWFVSQQAPTDHESVNGIDVTAALEELAAADDRLWHWQAFDLPGQEQKLVITTPGIVALGELLAENYLELRGR